VIKHETLVQRVEISAAVAFECAAREAKSHHKKDESLTAWSLIGRSVESWRWVRELPLANPKGPGIGSLSPSAFVASSCARI
jgi:hypothetical protein